MRKLTIAVLVIGTLFLALACRAQDLSHFEVASIRPSPPNPRLSPGMVPAPIEEGGPGTANPGQITYRDISLSSLINQAYGVRYDQVSGPGSPYPQRFDIIAKIPAGATKEQFKLMLQNLLAERFNLQLHHESRILPACALTVAKNGPRLKESAKDVPPELPPGTAIGGGLDDSGFPTLPANFTGARGFPSNGHIRWKGQRVAISVVGGLLNLDHPVVDQTGLTGEYDFKLDFAMAGRRNGPAADPPVGDTADPAPDVFAAVEAQLGLKLELKKLPFDVLVIDHIDKESTAN
jgi:uncharacterized protein (TIGR03435 family)